MKRNSLILFALLFLGLLAACGGAVEEESAAPPADDAITEAASDEQTAVNEETDDAPALAEIDDAPAAADDFYADAEMEPEDCFPGELYDPEEKVCYIECDSEEECLAKEEEIYGNLDDKYLDTEFGGETVQPPDFAGGPADGEDGEPLPIARYNVPDTLETVLLEKNEEVTDIKLADPDRHEEIWSAVRYLLPNDALREDVGRFYIFTDGPDNSLAYVEPLPGNAEEWQFGIDIVDAGYTKDFVHTLIHEFAHIVTLGKKQVPPDSSLPSSSGGEEFVEPSPIELSCATFYTGEGCSNPDSYINLFFQRFWSDIYEENLAGSNEAETQEEMDEFVAEFYDEYSDRFLSEYAATNPGEDIAESFTFFVLQEKPDGDTIAEQKILFFYEFEPLVKMRTQMRGQLARLDK
jgi:hypothetical protein